MAGRDFDGDGASRASTRRALDELGAAALAEAVEKCFDHLLVAEKFVPDIVRQIGGNEGGALGDVALFHQFEEGVGLLGAQIQISHFVHQQNIHTRERIEELSRRAVGEAGVQFVEEILCAQETTTEPPQGHAEGGRSRCRFCRRREGLPGRDFRRARRSPVCRVA